jgi:general secretion pathway protein G
MLTTLNRMKNEEGFTLIELMIVMVVLGILAGIVLFAVGPFQTAATEAKTTADADACKTAAAAASATLTTADDANTFVDSGTCP